MEKKFFQKPTTYVGEVNINVSNIIHSLDFYQRVFGFKILEQTERKVILSADGERPLLTLEQPEDVMPKKGRTTGLYHFAILLPTRADLASFLKHLIQTEGHSLRLGASDHDVSEALYFDDPDGNGIEVACDRSSSKWGWNEGIVTMGTTALDANDLLAETDQAWEGIPNDTVMGHIHLHVADLDETETFYVNGLGFDIVTRYHGALFASTGGYHHHLGLNVWNGVGAPPAAENSVGLNWFTLVFADHMTRDKQMKQLGEIGANVIEEDDYYVVNDPAGNTIRFVVEE
ncbi:VOC family protein [Ornithinibacillus xuwenensis]|uniref:VOC family protein n=1 Tax=Ornithinibacillus xuwenensis TaxID=3144668 RepID=A0ABU9XLM2_9BACI